MTGGGITSDYIEYASDTAHSEGLNVRFIHSDIRDVNFENEFDAVLNMADGAVSYLENEEENLKIFKVRSKALKARGKHFMDIAYGTVISLPVIEYGNPTRLYSLCEIKNIFANPGMKIIETYSDFGGKAASADDIQLTVYPEKL